MAWEPLWAARMQRAQRAAPQVVSVQLVAQRNLCWPGAVGVAEYEPVSRPMAKKLMAGRWSDESRASLVVEPGHGTGLGLAWL